MKVKKAMVVLAAALAGLGLTACGGGAKSTADGLEGKNISIMTPYLSSVTTNQMVENLQAGLEKEGAEVTVIDTANDFSKLASRIEDVVTAQTDGIILVSADPSQLENQLQEAFDANIPVFGCDSGFIEGMQVNATSDNYQMGQLITDYLFNDLMGGEGNVIALTHRPHRMDEIFRLTDRITVFKNGSMVSCVKTSEVDKDKLVSMMTDEWKGSDIVHNTNFGKVLLEVQGIRTKDGVMKKGSLKVREKEILGVFGLGGSGRTELLEGIYGYRPITEGTVTIDGEQQNMLSPANSIKKGMVLISEDRRGKALVGNLSIKENVLLSCIDRYAKHGYLDEKKEKQDVSEKAEALKIRMTGLDQRIIELSGGNQQKAVFAKALMTNPKVFLCDEPTQAVDIMTRNEIHKLLREKADAGNAVVYVSSDLKEILEVADTIQLVVQGETRQLLVNENLTTTEVLSYCYE